MEQPQLPFPLDVELAKKFDGGKVRMDLIPVRPLNDIAQVLTVGAAKYGARNWEKGMDWSRLYGAALRHITAFWSGEDNDPETGLPHLAHAICCLNFLLEYRYTHKNLDDRVKGGLCEKGNGIHGTANDIIPDTNLETNPATGLGTPCKALDDLTKSVDRLVSARDETLIGHFSLHV